MTRISSDKKIEKIMSFNLFKQKDIDELMKYDLEEIKKIAKWVLLAKEASVDVKLSDYKDNENWNETLSLFDPKFYKNRYSKYPFDEICKKSKETLLKKRGSMYDPENISKKKGISLDDARKISKDRKESTKITLENLVKKYGEEVGKEKYSIFLEKSKSTIENYKIRYGEQWQEKWDFFLKTRDSSSLDFHIKKYGKDNGEKKFLEQLLKFKKSSDIKYYKEKYGEEEGLRKFEFVNSRKAVGSISSWSFDSFKKKHAKETISEDELRSLFETYKKTRCTNTVEYFIAKGFSLEEAKDLRLKSIERMYRTQPQKNPVSKESIRFFSELQRMLGRTCSFGSKKDELLVKKDGRIFFYDFFDKETNTIIEYNGSLFHAPPNLSENEINNWRNKYGLTWQQVKLKDDTKINVAKSLGYNVIVVWDYEVRSKTKMNEKVSEILKLLGNKNES